MSIQTTTLGFTNSLQRLVWPSGADVPVTAYLWGGGGGGGGNDSAAGGPGGGGGFTEITFTVSAGDVIDVAVGGPGGGGASGRGSAAGGSAGASYVSEQIFDTRSAVSSPPVIASTNSAYVSFLNSYGIWVNPVSARDFDRSYTVNFPLTGKYTFTSSADNYADIYLDGDLVGHVPGYSATYTFDRDVTAGNHTIRIVAVNTGGPGSVALTVSGGTSYSGGRGGAAGPAGSSGGGGGGGGATVLFKNGTPVAVASGGGGGGGAGNRGISRGDAAPGSDGQAAEGITAGQNGQSHPGDGGGAGGGGGGLGGGNGGLVRDGDQGARAGAFGLSTSPAQTPNGPNAGNNLSPFYIGSVGTGGATASGGTAGAAVLVFNVPGIFVKDGPSFEPVNKIWTLVENKWEEVKIAYIKTDGVWTPIAGSFAPAFSKITGNFGINPRTAVS
jgi:hypothetical protein